MSEARRPAPINRATAVRVWALRAERDPAGLLGVAAAPRSGRPSDGVYQGNARTPPPQKPLSHRHSQEKGQHVSTRDMCQKVQNDMVCSRDEPRTPPGPAWLASRTEH